MDGTSSYIIGQQLARPPLRDPLETRTRALGSTLNPCDFRRSSGIERLPFDLSDDSRLRSSFTAKTPFGTTSMDTSPLTPTASTSLFKCLPSAPNWLGNFIKKWDARKQRIQEARRNLEEEINEVRNDRCELEYELRKRLTNTKLRNASLTVIHDLSIIVREPEEDLGVKVQEYLKLPPEHVVISKFNYHITRRDLDSLLGLSWLNDEVINFYMSLLSERSKQNTALPKTHAMNTFFLVRLQMSGYSGVRRWTRGVDIFQMDVIPVPVHVGQMHWCMAIIHLRDKYIRYYDSLGGPNQPALDALKSWLEAESLEKRKMPYDTSGFQLEHAAPNIPRQHNGSDCGVFSCMFAEYITRDAPITFTQTNMPRFRQKMYLEIATGSLRT